MEAVIDSVGRVVVPKPLRDALGLVPGTKVDITRYSGGLQLISTAPTADLVRDEDGYLVAVTSTPISTDTVRSLLDDQRR